MSTKSIWSDVLGKIECNHFEERLEELSALIGGTNRNFLNSRHKCRFYWLLREFKIENKDLLAVLYLMSSDSYLFWMLQDMVEDDSIEFDSFDLNPEHRYLILFQLMRDVSMGHEIIYYNLLADLLLLLPVLHRRVLLNLVLCSEHILQESGFQLLCTYRDKGLLMLLYLRYL